MGNKKSTSMQPVLEEEEEEREERVINLVNGEDKFFSEQFVKKKGPFQKTRIKKWTKEIWFYDPPANPSPETLFKAGYVESFDEEELTVTIRLGSNLYKQALWKVFMKVIPGVPSPKEWKARMDLVGYGSTYMDSTSNYNLKF